MDLSILIVSYNTWGLLKDCLRSIFKNTEGLIYEVIVVDNNSTDGSPQMIQEMFPQVLLLSNKENLGFSCANNQGYSHSKGEHLLFLNSDTLVLEGAITKMNDYLKAHPQVGIVGPKILNNQHQPTRSYMRFLNIKSLFLGSKYFKLFFDVERYRMHFSLYDFSSIQQVPWVSGACLMVKRNIFQEAGLFDERYFLYLEDMDLCLQVEKLGYRIVYLPTAEIVHLFGGSSSRTEPLSQVHKNSMAYYFKKNFPITHYWIAKLYLSFLINLFCKSS